MRRRIPLALLCAFSFVGRSFGGTSAVAARAPGGGDTKVEARASATMSLTRAPYPSPDEREISGLLTTLLVDVRALVVPAVAVAFRWPLVLADVDLPAGAARPTHAWGHPEGSLCWRLLEQEGLIATLGGALAVPVLGDDEARLGRRPFDNQALVLASAQTGWRDRDVFAPGRLALTPSADVAMTRGRFLAFAHLDLPFLLALRRGSGDDRVRVRTLAGSVALGAGVAASFLDRLSFQVAPWVVIDALPAAEIKGESPPRWTLSLATAARVRVRGPVTAELGSTLFVAGALSGLPSFTLGLGAAW